jgi:hypothetical protein
MAKFILIYNKESEVERNAFAKIREQMSSYIIAEHDFQDVRDFYPVVSTPALIPILDHLCGEHLLEGEASLIMVAEANRLHEEEELKIHNVETNRLDNVILGEKIKAEDALLTDLLERGVI